MKKTTIKAPTSRQASNTTNGSNTMPYEVLRQDLLACTRLGQTPETMKRLAASLIRLRDAGTDLEAFCEAQGTEIGRLPALVQKIVSDAKFEDFTVAVKLQIPLWMFGEFCAAAKFHGLESWEEALDEYLHKTVIEWSNEGYFLQQV